MVHCGKKYIPYEIWECIFKYLSANELFNCSKVCSEFKTIIQRLTERLCLKEIPTRLLLEYIEEENLELDDNCENLWEKIYCKYYNSYKHLEFKPSYDYQEATDVLPNFMFQDGITVSIEGESESLTIFVCGMSFILPRTISRVKHFFILKLPEYVVFVSDGISGVFLFIDIKHKEIKELNIIDKDKDILCPTRLHEWNTFVHGSTIASILPRDSKIVLRKIKLKDLKGILSLEVNKTCFIELFQLAVHLSIWHSFITLMTSEGIIEVLKIPEAFINSDVDIEKGNQDTVLSITKDDCFLRRSGMIKDLRYSNPCRLANGFLFSSTEISAAMLGFWHMNRDIDYWFFANVLTNEDLKAIGNKLFPYKKINYDFICPNIRENEITCDKIRFSDFSIKMMEYKRGLLFCLANCDVAQYLLIYKIYNEMDSRVNNVDNLLAKTSPNWNMVFPGTPNCSFLLTRDTHNAVYEICPVFLDSILTIYCLGCDKHYRILIPLIK